MSAQLTLYDEPSPLEEPRDQLNRLDIGTRALMDAWLERGAKLEVLDDFAVEEARRVGPDPRQLRVLVELRARGDRRAWYRAPSPPERERNIGMRSVGGVWWIFVAYEPRVERELGATGRRTEHERSKQTHWPTSYVARCAMCGGNRESCGHFVGAGAL